MTEILLSYHESRLRFRKAVNRLRAIWPAAKPGKHTLANESDLSIDWIHAPAGRKKKNLFMLTTGLHGVEGFVGAAMLQLFIEEFAPRMNPAHTGLLLVHALNPWGMKNRRRTNKNNVDLNRNFVEDPARLKDFNPDYSRLDSFLNPRQPLHNWIKSELAFISQIPLLAFRFGQQGLRESILMGQYRHPQGLYFGGEELQEETRVLMALYRKHIHGYANIIHIDIHTSYGPRARLTLVQSQWEKMTSKDARHKYGIPRVVCIDPKEFYSIKGDMTDYLYTMVEKDFPGKVIYSAAFEYGTYGESLAATLRGLRSTVFENQLYWFDGSAQAQSRLSHEFIKYHAPEAANWLAQAARDTRQALAGILRAERLIP